MAIWQTHIRFLPRHLAREYSQILGDLETASEWDPSTAWLGRRADKAFIEKIDDFWPRAAHWDENSMYWKTPDHDSDITLGLAGNNIEFLDIRVDLRSAEQKLYHKIATLADDLETVLYFIEERKLCLADAAELKSLAAQSRAASFVRDPKKFLADLEKDQLS